MNWTKLKNSVIDAYNQIKPRVQVWLNAAVEKGKEVWAIVAKKAQIWTEFAAEKVKVTAEWARAKMTEIVEKIKPLNAAPEHTKNDEVELIFEQIKDFYFTTYWRFKPVKHKKKLLFWEWEGLSREKWRTVSKYNYPKVSLRDECGNPYSDCCWRPIEFFVGDEDGRNEFRKATSKIKTFKDLDREFDIHKAYTQWEKDKAEYDKLVEDFNAVLDKGF